MNAKLLVKPAAFFLVCSLLYAGCATMRVDVDVYKGPMTNHEDVQTEQLAAMAIGAKPLLIQLRDNLAGIDSATPGWESKDVRGAEDLNGSYSAIRVNGILQLYRDTTSPYIKYLLDEGKRELKALQVTIAKLAANPDDALLTNAFRESMDELFLLGLEFIRATEDDDTIPVPAKKTIQIVAGDFSIALLRAGSLANLMNDQEASAKISGLSPDNPLLEFKKHWNRDKEYASIGDSRERWRVPKDELHKIVRELPVEFANFLEIAFFSHADWAMQEERDESFTLAKPDWSSGRSVSSYATREAIQGLTQLHQAVGSATGFERGRVHKGLESLIEEYLYATADKEAERIALRKALVRFAEKVLFVANHDILLRRGERRVSSAPARTGYARGRPPRTGRRSSKTIQQYTMVLQAVGNSILAQADELTYVEEYHARDKRGKDREQLAFENALQADPVTVVKRLLTDIAVEKAAKEEELEILTAKKASLNETLGNDDTDTESQESAGQEANAAGEAPGASESDAEAGDVEVLSSDEEEEKPEAESGLDEEERQRLQQRLDDLDDQIGQTESRIALLDNAASVIDGVRPKLFESLSEDQAPIGSETIIAHLRLCVTVAKDEARGENDKKKSPPGDEGGTDSGADAGNDNREEKDPNRYTHALEYLDGISPRMSPEFEIAKNSENRRDVMDQLIAALKHEHVQAVKEGGEGSESAKRIGAAIETAARHRADMVHIRPSGAYLRSSYPSTSLQGGPGLGWRNMLAESWMRTIPGLGPPIYNAMQGNPGWKRRTVAEIDKQYWHNINSVRVTGGGRTNYVIAKDDVGNWYVKNYSANPEKMIKSAQSLALFSLGGELGTDLLGRLPKDGTDGVTKATNEQMVTTARTPLGKVFEKHATEYRDATIRDTDEAIRQLDADGLKKQITGTISDSSATRSLRKKLNGFVDRAWDTHLKAVLSSLKTERDGMEEAGKEDLLELLQAIGNNQPLRAVAVAGRALAKTGSDGHTAGGVIIQAIQTLHAFRAGATADMAGFAAASEAVVLAQEIQENLDVKRTTREELLTAIAARSATDDPDPGNTEVEVAENMEEPAATAPPPEDGTQPQGQATSEEQELLDQLGEEIQELEEAIALLQDDKEGPAFIQASVKVAVDTVNGKTQAVIDELLGRRKEAVADYENAVRFLLEAIQG